MAVMKIPRALVQCVIGPIGLALAILTPYRAAASWPTDSLANVPVCAAPNDQYNCRAVPDGAGGVLFTWMDYRSGAYPDVYAQHVRATGDVDAAWPTGGLGVCTLPGFQGDPVIVSDGVGGAVIVWDGGNIFAHHVLSNGVLDPAWPATGRALCSVPNTESSPLMVSDGAGGAIAAWNDVRNGANTDIYAQHVRANGQLDPAWPVDGRALCTAPYYQDVGGIVADGSGGAFVTWEDDRVDGVYKDIYAQHVLANGRVDPAWPVDGLGVCTAPGFQEAPTMVGDGSGGAIITWQDARTANGDYHVYAQHVLATGVADPVWPAGGRAVCTAPRHQERPVIVTDSAGGAVVVWLDYRNQNNYRDLYAQHVLANGIVDTAWPVDGLAVCTTPGDKWLPSPVADDVGAVLVAWQDMRNGPEDIYAQRLLPNGTLDSAWPPNGRALCAAPGSQVGAAAVSDGFRGAIVGWADFRNGSDDDIYAQRVLANGQLGGDLPTATQASLVAVDTQDGVVRLTWYASGGVLAAVAVERMATNEAWRVIGTVTADGAGYVRFDDEATVAGTRYGYRLVLPTDTGTKTWSDVAWVDVPPSGDLVRIPNPVTSGALTVSMSAPSGRAVAVELFDPLGRRVAARLVTGGGGLQRVELARSDDLAPGVYLVRVGLDRPVVTRVAVIR
jgi:hypothetical protein